MMPELQKQNWSMALMANAFALPGIGHMMVGRWTSGIILSVSTLIFIILPIIRYAMTMMNSLISASDLARGMPQATYSAASAWSANKGFILTCLALAAFVWIFGIVDIWLMKRKALGKPSLVARR